MPTSGSSSQPVYMGSLSSRERLILAEWERARVTRVTRADVAALWGAEKADKITSALVRKGALRRVGKGIFLVVPFRAQARPSTPSAATIVAALLSDETYYLGGLWALTYHRLTLQQYATRIDVFAARAHQPRTLAHAQVRFHRVPASRIAKGSEVTSLEDAPARVSTRETTLLDLLEARAEKVRAAFTREAIRDLYDLEQLARAGADLSSPEFISLADAKLAELGAKPLREQPPSFGAAVGPRRRSLEMSLTHELRAVTCSADNWLDALSMLVVAAEWATGKRKLLKSKDGTVQTWVDEKDCMIALPWTDLTGPPKALLTHEQAMGRITLCKQGP